MGDTSGSRVLMAEVEIATAETAVATSKPATADDIVNAPKTVFYRTEDDSDGAKCLRKLRCGCFDPAYTFTTEAVKISEFHCISGGCCVRKDESIDVDEIKDIAMVQTLSPGMLLYKRGHFIFHILEKGDAEVKQRHIWHIENAPEIYKEYSAHVSKMNNLVLGMARPDTDAPEELYNSKDDSAGLKFCRTIVCCGCCCFPNTHITKRHINTDQWACSTKYLSCPGNMCGCLIKDFKNLDTDFIKDVELEQNLCHMCCGAGKIIVEAPADIDQDKVVISYMGNAKEIYKQFDEFVNKLDNRDRVIGEGSMGR